MSCRQGKNSHAAIAYNLQRDTLETRICRAGVNQKGEVGMTVDINKPRRDVEQSPLPPRAVWRQFP